MSTVLRNSGVRHDGFQVAVANQQSRHAVNEDQLAAAVRAVLQRSAYRTAAVSLAIVDDPTIHELNRSYLDHDWPTDVLSFVLAEDGIHLEGEVIISADTAAAVSAEIGWPAAGEQLLYVVHGMLHLVGYSDKDTAAAERMREAESELLLLFGFNSPREDSGEVEHANMGVIRSSAGVRRP
jgi:probable rRNA maturation factor